MISKYELDSKNNISIKKSGECKNYLNTNTSVIRKSFIQECLPLYDMLNSKINILKKYDDYNEYGYIYYYNDDIDNEYSYVLENDFSLSKHTIEKVQPKSPLNYLQFMNKLQEKLNYNFKISENIMIPIYYFFIDSKEIFNIFIAKAK